MKRWIIFISLILIVNILMVTIFAFAPIGQSFEDSDGEATVFISSDRRWVLNLNDCVNLSWDIQGIQEVYVNNRSTTGENTMSYCINQPDTAITWSILNQDGIVSDYVLHVDLLLYQPLVWVFIFLGLSAFLALCAVVLVNLLQPKLHQTLKTLQVAVEKIGSIGIYAILFSCLAYLVLNTFLTNHFAHYGDQKEQQRYLTPVDELRDLRPNRHPLAGYEGSQYNVLGYRGEEIALPKPEGLYRIVAIGDSTTAGVAVSEAYPEILQRLLRDEGYIVEVINAGIPGAVSWDHLDNLAFRVLELEPDLVIFYAANNDMSVRQLPPDCYAGQKNYLGLNPSLGFKIPYIYRLPNNTLDRFILLTAGIFPDPLDPINEKYLDCADEPDLDNVESNLEQNEPHYYERNIRSFIGVAQAHDVDVLLSTWAYSTSYPQPDWWYNAMSEQNAIVTEVAQSFQTHYVDVWSGLFQDATYWFSDGYHQSPEGHTEQARLYAQYIIDNILDN